MDELMANDPLEAGGYPDRLIEDALRTAPLAEPPGDLYRQVMLRVIPPRVEMRFELSWLDIAGVCLGTLLFALVLVLSGLPWLGFEPVDPQIVWFWQWLDYAARLYLVWLVPPLLLMLCGGGAYLIYRCSAGRRCVKIRP